MQRIDHISLKDHTILDLTQQLLTLGVQPGGVLLVHTAFSQVSPVEDGPLGLIQALREVLGPQGTLVMPSMTYDDSQPFDPKSTHCKENMGVVADIFWRIPGVLRSDSPHAFAAIGPQAAHITTPHPVDVPHGLNSPVGRVYELDGQVLLLGVGHGANTTIHLAENIEGVRYRRPSQAMILQDGVPTLVKFGEIDHCCENFGLVNQWLDEKGLQQRGKVGNASALLMRSRDVVEVVTNHLQANETIFLHALGVDEQCDEARRSIPS
jgi:aminoglycoside 3-N-acetyltransferase